MSGGWDWCGFKVCSLMLFPGDLAGVFFGRHHDVVVVDNAEENVVFPSR